VNRDIELNIYGDPAAPAGIELGIYGSRKNDEKLQEALRAYFAGFLTMRQEIAAFYRIGLREGKATAGVMTFEVVPATAPNSEGAWWISLYNAKTLNASRLSQAKYDELTKPLDEVVARDGSVIAKGWSKNDLMKTDRAKFLYDKRKVQLRGFYRDKNGDFQLLTSKRP